MKNMFIDFTDNFSTTAAVYNILHESIDNEVANGEIITEEQPLYLEFIAFGEAITNDEASYYFTPMMDELRSGKEKAITSAMFNDSIRYNTFHIGNGLVQFRAEVLACYPAVGSQDLQHIPVVLQVLPNGQCKPGDLAFNDLSPLLNKIKDAVIS